MTGMPPELSRAAQARIDSLVEAYKKAQTRLNKMLTKASLTDFQSFRINEQLTQINRIIDALDKAAKDTTKALVPELYMQGADIAAEAMREYGKDVADINMGNKIHTAAVQALTDQMASDLLFADESLRTYSRKILRQTQQVLIDESQINEIISRGIIEGETRRAVSSTLRRKIEEALDGGMKVEVRGKDGKTRKYDPEYYSEIVVKTRTRECVTEGSVRFGQQNGVYLFIVSVHDNPCQEICQARQGKVYSTIDGTGFPDMDRRPPYHPSCRHVLIPFVAADDDEEERLREFSNSEKITSDLKHYQSVISGRSKGLKSD